MTRELDFPMYGLVAEFEDEGALLRAARATHEAGYRQVEAYSPFPVDGLAEALGYHPRFRVNWVVVGGLAVGALAGFAMQYYAVVIDYPINVGGRPLNSWPSFVPVAFELAILVAAITAIVGMFIFNGLPRWRHPLFGVPQFARATQDCFFLFIESSDPQFDVGRTAQFLQSLEPVEVMSVER